MFNVESSIKVPVNEQDQYCLLLPIDEQYVVLPDNGLAGKVSYRRCIVYLFYTTDKQPF